MFSRGTGRRKARLITAGAAALSIPFALTACTGSSSSDPGSIQLWLASPPISDQEAVLTGVYGDAFTESHPGTSVDITFSPVDALGQKTQTALAAGQGPSIVGTGGPASVTPFAQAGYFTDLSDLAKENGLDEKIFPWALQAGTVDGKLVALPSAYESLVLFYNKTVFEENGWEPPTDRASMDTLAQEMEAKGIIPFAGGNADYRPLVEITLSALLNQVAGPGYIHDALTGDASWADQPCVDTAQTMIDWFDDGWIGGSSEEYFTKGFSAMYQDFASGDAGMLISGSYEFTQLPAYFGTDGNTSEWDWVPLPPLSDDVPSNVYPLAVGGTYSVNAQVDNVDTAETWLSWLYDNDSAAWADVSAGIDGATPLPMKFDAAEVPDNVDSRTVEHYEQINAASEQNMVGYVSYTSFGPKTEAFVVANTEKLATGDVTAKDFCGQLDSVSQEDLAAGTVPAVWTTDAR